MKNEERISKLKSCVTIDELMEDIFPSYMDGVATSRPTKRRLTKEWIESYKDRTLRQPTFKYDNPQQLAEAIYPVSWDDNTLLFQELRGALIEWIESYKEL